MIWREQNDQLVIIAQHDHALLAGEMAKKIGNALFAPPSPFEPVVYAIAQHDCGWIEADRRPTPDPLGQPTHVFESDPMISITAWEKSVDQTVAHDPYSGLLVSLHAMSLANRTAARQPEPTDELSRQRVFRIRRFVHLQIELQEELRRQLQMNTDLPLRGGLAEEGRSPDEDLLRTNFFLLEFLDQLSLDLCFNRLVFQRIEMIYPRAGMSSLTARVASDAGGGMMISPWPFNSECLELDVPAKRIPKGPYRNTEALHDACEAAQRFSLRMVLLPTGS